MKNIFLKFTIVSVTVGGLLTFSGCQDYLEVENPSTLSQTAVFNSVSYTNSAIIGVYNKLIGDDGYGSRVSMLYPQSSEEFKTSGDYNPDDRRGISHYGASANNNELLNPFNQMYQGIERANICIKYISASNLYTNGTDAEKAAMRRFYGEALTLRAQFYYELVRNWGDLPAHFEPAADLADLYLSKTDRDIIYDKLLADLEIAEEFIPWRSEAPGGIPATRLSKAAVKGLRARIALAVGGYSLRRDTQLMERRADYKDYYQIARDECMEIMQHRDQHDLNPVYENIFRDLHGTGNFDLANELIFEVGAFGGNARTDSKLGYSNGLRMDANSSWGTANGQLAAIPTYFYEFHPYADVRRDVTIANFRVDGTNNKIPTSAVEMRDGKFRKYWTNIRDASQSLGINWPILRFADVLLMFAEAENELNNGPTAAAISAFEEVRKRAFAGNEGLIGATPSSYEGFFDAIVKERLLEFGGEGIRKYDLIRWNLLGVKIEETREKLRRFMNREGEYTNVPERIYYRPTLLMNSSTVPQEMATFDLYGGSISTVYFTAAPASAPAGYSSINWTAAMNENQITGNAGFATKFEPNRKELFPLHNGVLNQNYRLTQDYGYADGE